MTEPELERLGAEEQRMSEALRSLEPPAADTAYRARLKREFLSGAFAPVAAPERPRSAARPLHRQRALRWAMLPVAAAALIVAVSVLNQGPRWELTASRGEGIAVIDGVPVPVPHSADLARRLRPGARVRLPEDSELEIVSRGQIAMQITPGTDMALPETPGRWFARRAHANVEHGEVRITTGVRFRGARLEVETLEAMVEVTGTTLAVICEAAGTCVCVLEGRVTVAGKSEGTKVVIGEGRRRFVFNDARPPETAAIRPTEHVQLGMFREQRRGMLEAR